MTSNSAFINFIGFTVTLGVPLIIVYIHNSKKQYQPNANGKGNTSSLQNSSRLRNTLYDDFEGENRNYLLQVDKIRKGFFQGRLDNMIQSKMNLESDRNYNGLNHIRYKKTKFDLLNGRVNRRNT